MASAVVGRKESVGAHALPGALGALRGKRAGKAAVAIAAMLAAPLSAQAQSAGCMAVNAGLLNTVTTFSGGSIQSTTAAAQSIQPGQSADQYVRTNGSYVSGGTTPVSTFAASNLSLQAGEILNYGISVSNYASATGSKIQAVLRVSTGSDLAATLTPANFPFVTSSGSSATVNYTLPANLAAVGVSVRVASTTDQSGTATLTVTCTPLPAPVVSSISPTGGSTGGGTPVTITGSDFVSGNTYTATFGGSTVAATYASASMLTATAPAGTGTVSVTVRNTTTSTNATGSASYTYAAPTVTGLSKTVGPANAVQAGVTISGTNFTPGATVSVGGTAASNVAYISASQLRADFPSIGAGQHQVLVTTGTVTSAANPPASTFLYYPVPTVTSVTPNSGPIAGTTRVTIRGTNLLPASGTPNITIGGGAATVDPLDPQSASEVVVYTPNGSAGAATVAATTEGGTGQLAGGFTYAAAPPAPVVIGPANGATVTTATPNVTGTAQANATVTVSIDGTQRGTTSATAGGAFSFPVPTTLGQGSHTVFATATTAGGTSPNSNTNTFTVDTVAPAAPVITSPTEGQQVLNTRQPINGTAEAGSSVRVFIDGSQVGSAMTANGSGVFSVTPQSGQALARGSHTATATATDAAGNVSTLSTAVTFIVVTVPVIDSIAPTSGSTGGGSDVQLNGAGMNSVTRVSFGGVDGHSIRHNGDGVLRVIAPAGSAGAKAVVAYNPAGNSSAAINFTYVAPPVANAQNVAVPFQTATPVTLTGSDPGGQTLTYALVATPTKGALTGILPNLTYTPNNGARGADSLTFTVSNGSSDSEAIVSFTIADPVLTLTSPTATGTAGATYSSGTTASGGTAPYSFQVTSGALPPGITLGSTGSPTRAISGVPTTAGSYDFTITTTDSTAGSPAVTKSSQFNITIARGAQTISFTSAAPSAAKVAGSTYTPTATATSGLATTILVDPIASAVCSISGGIVSFNRAGTCMLNADQSGNASYTAAPQVQQSFTVGQGGQTITFTSTAPSAATVGGAPYTVSATATSGLPVVFMLDGSSTGCALSSGSVTFGSTGTCVINANQAGDSNWSPAAQGQQTFAIGAATAVTSSVSFSAPSIGVGGTGTLTITFGNNNASATPAIAPLLSASALFNRTGAIGGSCGASGSDAGASFQFNGFSIPAGGCTVTLDYRGTTAGATSGFVLGAFTPNGYPTTLAATGTPIAVVPTITSIAPNSGPVSQVVTISGTGFSTTPGNNTVKFGTVNGTVTGASATSLVVTAPATGTGSVGVTVTVNAQTSTDAQTYTFVAKPIAADKPGVGVPYNSTGTAIDLATSITGGAHGSISIGTGPAHGTASVNGDVVTYIPDTGHFGADSFTYTATGIGGTSNVATVSLIVATPGAPVAAARSGVAVTYESTGTAIDLSSSITGIHGSIAIATLPTNGGVTINGDVVTYTPNAAYFGPDSFTYTASGPGGTSAPATVSLTVATPPAPVAANKSGVAVAYESTGTVIDLSGSITGVHTGIAIGTVPAHGSLTINGDVVTYTPDATYFGPDSFTYTVTGPGGTSAAATVSLTVATPAAPVAANKSGVAVAYDSSGTAIDLSGSISGVHGSIAIGTVPAHGSVTVTGDVVTYTPTAGYFGSDSFTYTATGPGGTSSVATVSLTVATPAPPIAANRNGIAVAYASSGTAIDLSASITGVHSSIAIGTMPAHGTVTITGDVVTYTPAATYFGTDSFTYTATGPGGTSPAATVSLTVATPAAPVVAGKAGVAVAYISSGTAIDLSASITGVHASIAVATAPAHGTVTIAGDVVTYVPATGYFGADSFTYTATGPGGTSAPATVSLTVATPAAPAVTNASAAVPYNGTGTAIDLSASVIGVHTALTIGTAPAHGTVTIAGDVVTYTPTAGYFGADSFTYTATGPGGTSTAATVSITVATPPAPVTADKPGVAVAFNGTGTVIDLSGAITGVHTLVQIGTQPAYGTVTITGDVVTYKPNTDYFGADSFTYTATGPGGTSAPATVSLTVATPAAPVAVGKNGFAVPYNGAGTAIDLSALITGVHTQVEIGSQPAHGMVLIAGDVVTYKPTANYFGADSFTYIVTGPGGISNAATIGLNVASPPPPVTTPGTGSVAGSSSVSAGTSVSIDLSALVTGDYTSIEIVTQPAHGTVTLTTAGTAGNRSAGGQGALALPRVTATYRPAVGFAGTDSFTFAAVGPGGRSPAAAIMVTVVGSVPVALAKTAATGDGQTVAVELTAGATEGPFTAATIVTVAPASAATTRIVDSGTGAARSFRLEVTPNARYSGNVVVSYTLTNAYGTSAPATVTVAVTARPNPTADANVRGVSDAQAESTRRFARGQVANFMRRTEQLHGGGGESGASNGITLSSRDGRGYVRERPAFDASALDITERMRPQANDPMMGRVANMRGTGFGAGMIDGIAGQETPHREGAVERPVLSEDSEAGSGERKKGSVAIWSGGAIDIGTQDATTQRSKITATTSGLSAGMDVKVADGVIVGLGGGYGNDVSHIGKTAARVRSTSSLFAAYASVSPGSSAFIDGMIGVGDLSFSTRRAVATLNVNALGSRDGRFTVGAISAGIDQSDETLRWSLYGRGEFMNATLGSYSETGAGNMNLRFDERDLKSLTGTLGARVEFVTKTDFATITPRLRAEWNHEFADADAQLLDYADIPGAALFSLATQGWSRDQYQLTGGFRFAFERRWSFDIEAGYRAGSGQQAGTLRLQLSKEF